MALARKERLAKELVEKSVISDRGRKAKAQLTAMNYKQIIINKIIILKVPSKNRWCHSPSKSSSLSLVWRSARSLGL